MIHTQITKDTLTITIDISRESIAQAIPSSTGKTRLVASTHGAMPIQTAHGTLTLALNLMVK